MLDYFTHRFDKNNFRLIMTILVKNEADIIEKNIKTHARLGVDGFVVMDNGSTDGTREILSQLQQNLKYTSSMKAVPITKLNGCSNLPRSPKTGLKPTG